MNYTIFRFMCLVSILLLMAGVSYGCVTRVVSSPYLSTEMIDDGHGVLLGAHRLDPDGKTQLSALKWSNDMKWWIEEVTYGKQSQIVRVPLDGTFAVKLPVGSCRVRKIIIDSSRGKWHAMLPTAFEIRSQECTSLGTAELHVDVGFLTGWITRRVLSEQERANDNHEWIVGIEKCPTSMAQLDSPMKHSVKLELNEKQLDRLH